jgi:acetolactate synthase regulatory subunit
MKFTLEIRLQNSEGALERILGRLRQRSFSLCGIVATINSEEGSIDARITVEGTRAAEPIIRQIGKLYDVELVKVYAEAESNNGYRPFQNQREVEAYMPV